MQELIHQFIVSTKYVSIFLLMFVLPSEAVMPVVGYVASSSHIPLLPAVVAGAAGTTMWSIAVYTLASVSGQKAVYAWIDRRGKWLGVTKKNIEQAGRRFDRHAGAAVALGKFVPGLRTAVCIPAGFRRMPFGLFVLYAATGSLVDCLLLAYLGHAAHANFDQLWIVINDLATLIAIGLSAALLAWILWRHYRH